MSSHLASTVGSGLLGLVGIAAAVFALWLLVGWVRRNLGRLGLSRSEVGFIIWATFIGAAINIPLLPFGEGFLGINVGGAVVPVIVSVLMITRKDLPINEVLVGVVVVSAVTHLVSEYQPGVGVISVFPLWLLPAFAAFLVASFAWWHERSDASALAYVSGVLGALIGADIIRIPLILSGPAPTEPVVLSIGGGAIFDMVYLTGILAVAMETSQLAREKFRLGRPGRGNPLDEEFSSWVRGIEAWEEEKRRRREALNARGGGRSTSPPRSGAPQASRAQARPVSASREVDAAQGDDAPADVRSRPSDRRRTSSREAATRRREERARAFRARRARARARDRDRRRWPGEDGP